MPDHAFLKHPWGKDVCDAKITEGERSRTCCLPRREHGLSFYIASRIENATAVARLAAELKRAGHIHTYDWSVHGPVFRPDATPQANTAAMRAVSDLELDGVTSADVVIVLLPGGRGTHVEIGAALAAEKPIFLCADFPERLTGDQSGEYPWPCAFHYHRLVRHVLYPIEEVRTEAILGALAIMREARGA